MGKTVDVMQATIESLRAELGRAQWSHREADKRANTYMGFWEDEKAYRVAHNAMRKALASPYTEEVGVALLKHGYPLEMLKRLMP